MTDMQQDTITKKEKDYTDLESLLEAAKLSEFKPEPGYTEENQEFVKFESFFEIVKSSEIAELDVQEQNEVQKFDEDIADSPENSLAGESKEDSSQMDLAKPSDEINHLNFSYHSFLVFTCVAWLVSYTSFSFAFFFSNCWSFFL